MPEKKTRRRPSRTGAPGRRRTTDDHVGHGHAHFRLSPGTCRAIDAALKGLNSAQRERVQQAVDRAAEDAAAKVYRWLEKNVIGNANELLAAVASALVNDDRWDELDAIRRFLRHLDVPVDDDRVATAIAKEHGAELAEKYRQRIEPAR